MGKASVWARAAFYPFYQNDPTNWWAFDISAIFIINYISKSSQFMMRWDFIFGSIFGYQIVTYFCTETFTYFQPFIPFQNLYLHVQFALFYTIVLTVDLVWFFYQAFFHLSSPRTTSVSSNKHRNKINLFNNKQLLRIKLDSDLCSRIYVHKKIIRCLKSWLPKRLPKQVKKYSYCQIFLRIWNHNTRTWKESFD